MTIFKRFAIGSRQIAVCIVLGLLIVNLARAEDVRPTGKPQQLIKDQSVGSTASLQCLLGQ